MRRGLLAKALLALSIGILALVGCVEGEESAADPPEATAAPEPTATLDPEAEEAAELGIPHYEFPSGNQELYLLDLDDGEQHRLTDDQNQYMHPAWSPDGSRIAAAIFDRDQAGQTIVVMDADGSNLRELTDRAGQGPISWSPDGETIAFSTAGNPNIENREIHLIDSDGSNMRPLTDQALLEENERYHHPMAPAWSPDGRTIVFSANTFAHENTENAGLELFLVDLDGNGTPRQITSSPEIQKSNPVWHPDGESITFAGTDIENDETALYTIDISGENQELLHPETEHTRDAAWSPDGERIAFTREAFGKRDIHILHTESGEIEQLTDDEYSNINPAWSPDGGQIAFRANRDPRVAQPCSYGEIADVAPPEPFEDLAWISHQVVTVTILEEHEPAWAEPDLERRSGRSTECLRIMTDYTVQIETQFRGQEADTLRVRVRGGEIGQYEQTFEPFPELNAGDRHLMFLSEAPASEFLPDAYMLHMQRSWHISDDNTVEVMENFEPPETLPLGEIEERIREALSGEPTIQGSRLVPEEEAPIHVGIDDELAVFGEPCSFYVDYDLIPHPPIEDLAWSSGHIVVGTVVENLGKAWAEPDNVDRFQQTRGCLEIMNDYIIEVETQFHGEPAETLRIRAPGGELDGYEQLHGLAPDLNPGDRYLFFLFKAPESEMLPDAWAFDLQRARQVLAGDVVASGHDETMTLDEVEQLIAETLAGDPPPADELYRALWGSVNSETFPELEESDDE